MLSSDGRSPGPSVVSQRTTSDAQYGVSTYHLRRSVWRRNVPSQTLSMASQRTTSDAQYGVPTYQLRGSVWRRIVLMYIVVMFVDGVMQCVLGWPTGSDGHVEWVAAQCH